MAVRLSPPKVLPITWSLKLMSPLVELRVTSAVRVTFELNCWSSTVLMLPPRLVLPVKARDPSRATAPTAPANTILPEEALTVSASTAPPAVPSTADWKETLPVVDFSVALDVNTTLPP